MKEFLFFTLISIVCVLISCTNQQSTQSNSPQYDKLTFDKVTQIDYKSSADTQVTVDGLTGEVSITKYTNPICVTISNGHNEITATATTSTKTMTTAQSQIFHSLMTNFSLCNVHLAAVGNDNCSHPAPPSPNYCWPTTSSTNKLFTFHVTI